MYKNNITDKKIKTLYQIINEINEIHPLWWQHFIENIIGNSKITFINQSVLIVTLYELKVQDIVILYNILKKFKNYQLLDQVINKKEFLIIHINNSEIRSYLIAQSKWLNLVAYKYLSEYPDISNLELCNNSEETLKFTHLGTIYHISTSPVKEFKSNKWHKYIYLYKDLQIKYLNKVEYQLKYLRCKEEFYKNLKLIIEKNS